MNYVKPYRFTTVNQVAYLINGSTEAKEYIIEAIDIEQSLLKVSAIHRNDRLKIPFSRIEKAHMELLRLHFAEDFV